MFTGAIFVVRPKFNYANQKVSQDIKKGSPCVFYYGQKSFEIKI